MCAREEGVALFLNPSRPSTDAHSLCEVPLHPAPITSLALLPLLVWLPIGFECLISL